MAKNIKLQEREVPYIVPNFSKLWIRKYGIPTQLSLKLHVAWFKMVAIDDECKKQPEGLSTA